MNPTVAKALFDEEVRRLDGRLLESRDWVIHSGEYPTLDLSFRDAGHQELRLRLGCPDWNDTPPSVHLLDSAGAPLGAVPQLREGTSYFNGSPHPATGRPFVCTPGVLEYHQHPGHVGDSWSNYKGQDSYSLGGILTNLWRAWSRYWP